MPDTLLYDPNILYILKEVILAIFILVVIRNSFIAIKLLIMNF